ncbi:MULTISPECIES: methyl-accepting chemotaxis protein [Giesbergeria]|uniref:Methyl-accepting chemotaxis protein n=1 Tax=Giesbergeria sinuosa TaxID=80883 RepID=A0ABV9QEI3_9BURK
MTSIKLRLNVLFVVIISVLLLAFSAVSYFRTKSTLERNNAHQVEMALKRLSTNLPSLLWSFDSEQLSKNLDSEMSASFLNGIIITSGQKVLGGVSRGGDGKTVAATQPPAADFSKEVELFFHDGGKANPVGKAVIYVSTEEIREALGQELLRALLQVLILDVVIVIALSSILNSMVLNPLAHVGHALREIGQGDADLTRRLPRANTDEFNDVAEGFNTFVERLQKIMVQITQSVGTISHASEEIARGNMDLSARTESQASSLEQTAASMDEITNTVRQNADSAQQANQMVGAAAEVAARGGAVVKEVVQTMGAINASSRKIVDIISVIDGIAFQTNILALNAAVEAARAGEQGRGFAVVASEVRSLAGRSAAAAKEIKGLIDESVANVGIGSRLVDQAGSTMTDIEDSVSKVTGIMAEIHAATDAQTLGISQINEAIRQIDNNTQQNAALVEEAAAAAGSMQTQASHLAQAVSVFRLSESASSSRLLALR